MHPKALLDLASTLIEEALKLQSPADAVVSAFFRAHRQLGPRERHTLAETVYQVLRLRLRLAHQAQGGPGTLPRRLAALGWVGDAAFLQAALSVDERAWLDAAQRAPQQSLPPKLRHNLPDWVAQPLQARLGVEEFDALAQSLLMPAPLDLRVNTVKADRKRVQAELAEQGVDSEVTAYSPWGLRVHGRPALQRMELFSRGDVEVQDEGSQLLALVTDARRGEMVVDFCAGAGGKTLALGAMMRNTGRLYAFDTSGHRLAALKPRLARSGLSNLYAVQIAHERDDRIRRLNGKIDKVLVDAPCSGLGTLRRNPDLKWRQSPQAVRELQAKQSAILAAAARLLKPGGRLVYSTCSLLAEENEGIAQAFAEANPAFQAVNLGDTLQSAQISSASELTHENCLRLWPHRHGTDGFFAAAWQRLPG
jgi:16S rRNA (cytosine967-C5)-methyltransferase